MKRIAIILLFFIWQSTLPIYAVTELDNVRKENDQNGENEFLKDLDVAKQCSTRTATAGNLDVKLILKDLDK